MRLLGVFIVLCLQRIFGLNVKEPYDDFTTIECSSSEKSCSKPFCRLNEYGKLNNSISFGCDLQRSLSPVYVSRFLMLNMILMWVQLVGNQMKNTYEVSQSS